MPKKRPVTTDQLAGMVQRGFEEARGEMNEFRREVNRRFTGIENRLDALAVFTTAFHSSVVGS